MGMNVTQTQQPAQVPTQTATPTTNSEPQSYVRVPKGQLNRTRDDIPQGWSSHGKHGGFKNAAIQQSAQGFYLQAANPNDVPGAGRGRKH